MCGISITRRANAIDKIQHRGIESAQIAEGGWFLSHVRLPIQTELGDGLAQPIKLPENNGWLLYVGEIYNYPTRYSSDVEYLRDLFGAQIQEDILLEANHWDGMWAICWYREGRIVVFTDPLGKKQLYYNQFGEICSEITPLVSDFKDFDRYYQSEVAKWGYNWDDRTPWNNVKRIMPNTVYAFDNMTVKPKIIRNNYFNWGIGERNHFGKSQHAGILRGLVEKSVKRRAMYSKVPVGALVSGGLDSSIIASILHRMGLGVNLYMAENNESKFGTLLSEFLGVPIASLGPISDDDCLEKYLRYNETPIDLGSMIPQFRLMEKVREKVILTGDGADELFGGHRRVDDYDSQLSDVFQELPFYHMPRLDRASMRSTVELRSPFLGHDVVRFALRLPREDRTHKRILKEAFSDVLPQEIIDRPKECQSIRQDPMTYRKKCHETFYNLWK